MMDLFTTTHRELDKNNLMLSEKTVHKIQVLWERKKRWMRINIPRNAIDEMSTQISVLKTAISMGDTTTAKFQIIKVKSIWEEFKLYQ